MNTYKKIIDESHNRNGSSQNMEKQLREINKEKWLCKYASRILQLWSKWHTPLGIANVYTVEIKEYLANFYDDPLKKMFIESSY